MAVGTSASAASCAGARKACLERPHEGQSMIGAGRTSTIVLEQAFNAFPLPQDEPIRCANCDTRIVESQPISILVERSATGERWVCSTVWGAGCAPTAVATTEDVEKALVEGELAAVVDTGR